MNEDFLRWVAEKKLGGWCLSVCVCVCPSISGNNTRTAGPIGTGLAPIDAPKRRNDNGAGRGSAGGTCRPVKVYQKIFRAPGGQTGAATEPKLAGHPRTVPT